MSWGHLEIDTAQIKGLNQFLLGLKNRVNDFTPVLYDVAKRFREDIKEAIKTAGVSIGKPFAPLAPSTIERWGPHPPLINLKAAKSAGMLIDRLYFGAKPFTAYAFTTDPIANILEHGREAYASKAASPYTKKAKLAGSLAKAKGVKWGEMPARDPFNLAPGTLEWAFGRIASWAAGEDKAAA